jgi:hypothetical protein
VIASVSDNTFDERGEEFVGEAFAPAVAQDFQSVGGITSGGCGR